MVFYGLQYVLAFRMGQFVRGAGRLEGSVVPELKDRFHFFILFGRRDVAFYEVTGGAQKFRGACLARGGGKLLKERMRSLAVKLSFCTFRM